MNNHERRSNKIENNDGMSSELQAMLQKRLAKCTEETPTPSESASSLAAESITVSTATDKTFSSSSSTMKKSPTANTTRSTNVSISTNTSTKNVVTKTNSVHERYKFKSLSMSTANHDNTISSSNNKIKANNRNVQKIVTSPTNLLISSNNSYKTPLSSGTKSNNSKNSSGGLYSGGGASINYSTSIHSNNNEDSPFDEQITNSNNSIYQNVILKKVNLNKESFAKEQQQLIMTTDVDHRPTSNDNMDSVAVSSSGTPSGGNIQQHPYVKRYSPISFSDKEDNHDDDEQKEVGVVSNSIQQHPYLQRYVPSSVEITNTKSSNNSHPIDNSSKNGYNSKPKRFSPTFWNSSQSGTSTSTGIGISSNRKGQHQPKDVTMKQNETKGNHYSFKNNSARVDHNNNESDKSKVDSKSNKEKVTSKSTSSTTLIPPPPTSPISPGSPIQQQGLSLSHVNAMKKLFTKTNPQTQQSPSLPPPISPPSLINRKKSPTNSSNTTKFKNNVYQIENKMIQNSIINDDLTNKNDNLDLIERKEGLEMTQKSNINDIIDNDDIIPNFQDNENFASTNVFDNVTDWPDVSNKEFNHRDYVHDVAKAPIHDKDSRHASSSFFEPNMDWSDDIPKSPIIDKEPVTFSSTFDPNLSTAATTIADSNRTEWDWPSKNESDDKVMKQDPFPTTSFHFDQFDPFKEGEGKDDNELIIDDEPDVNQDCLNDEIILKTLPIAKLSNNHIGVVKNPLTNNLIACHQRDGNQWFIDEIDPHNSSVVASHHISTSAIRQKIASSTFSSEDGANLRRHIINGIENVLRISIGVHRQNNRSRARVAAILNLSVLGSGNHNDSLCVLAVWQWGYATSGSTIMLQNVIASPPSECFEPKSLCIADGLVFLAGSIRDPTGILVKQSPVPVIYIAKPHVRDHWTINKVISDSSQSLATEVVYMSVTPYVQRHLNLLAVALNDGSLSIWTYEKAVLTNRAVSNVKKRTGIVTQQLQLFCNLSSFFDSIEPTIFTSCYHNDDEINQQDDRHGK